jgi:hypothetical protein
MLMPLECYFSVEPQSKSLAEFTNELKRSVDTTKTFSFELAMLVLQQGYEVCTAIEKMDPKIASQLGVQCGMCQNKILSCAEIAGCLLGDGAQDQLDTLKGLLSKADVQAINTFIKNTANDQQVKCIVCEQSGHWVDIGQKH